MTNHENCRYIIVNVYLCLIFFNRRALENKYEPSVILLRNLLLFISVHFLRRFTFIHKMVNTPRSGILAQYQCPIHPHRVSGSCIQRWSIWSPHCSDYPQICCMICFLILGPEPAFGRLGLGGSSGGYSSHWYTSHALFEDQPRGKVMSQGANKPQRPFLANSIYSRNPISKMSINSCENQINSCRH